MVTHHAKALPVKRGKICLTYFICEPDYEPFYLEACFKNNGVPFPLLRYMFSPPRGLLSTCDTTLSVPATVK